MLQNGLAKQGRWRGLRVEAKGRQGGAARDGPVAVRQAMGKRMFKQTIRFERAQDAFVFDQHMLDFLRVWDQDDHSNDNDACVFTTSLQDEDAYIRVVQTDSADLLGSLLNFLSMRDFPPTTPVEPQRGVLSI